MRDYAEAFAVALVATLVTILVAAAFSGCTLNTRRQRPGPPMVCYLVAMRCSVDTGAIPPLLTVPKEQLHE